ncbi:uncharacterized protein LOC107030116 [Solanum pennellii]|uniref:Uncharacterized protein LOC107030116 n=1 Tax=Solanum pennellii TaxID=28526 RepID=A0ABM1HKY6_SOLPN|nr:uncharacterized protein LOC107030116 [Solanum pennellii]
MVKDMRRRTILFVDDFGRASSGEGRAGMLIRDIDISRLMVYVQKVEEEKLRDREEYKKRNLRLGMSLVNRRVVKVDLGLFQCDREGHYMKEASKNKQGGGNPGNRAQSSSVAPPDRVALRGATFGSG